MATERLSDRAAKAAKIGKNKKGEPAPRLYCDGGGLNLQVTPGKEQGEVNKSWLFRFTSPLTCKERQMGLGSYPDVSLVDARDKATDARRLGVRG
jgi:hypothetical protein